MIIVRLDGGLGNQLFQYAVGRALAVRHRRPLLLDRIFYSPGSFRGLYLPDFKIKAWIAPHGVVALFNGYPKYGFIKRTLVRATSLLRVRVVEDREQGFDESLLEMPSCYLKGFWQSERYFKSIERALRRELQPRRPLVPHINEQARRIAACNSVGIHARRGDLLTNPNHAALEISYYDRALQVIEQRHPDARAFIFSDDPQWAAANLHTRLPVEIVSGRGPQTPFEDFSLLAACRHFVIANSTFSWWAAWLGAHPDKTVIAPLDWRHPRLSESCLRDLVPAEWVRC